MTRPGGRHAPGRQLAAMEPVRHGRDDDQARGADLFPLSRPQWSPSVTDGMTRPASWKAEPDEGPAAMEPVRHGRVDGRRRTAGARVATGGPRARAERT